MEPQVSVAEGVVALAVSVCLSLLFTVVWHKPTQTRPYGIVFRV